MAPPPPRRSDSTPNKPHGAPPTAATRPRSPTRYAPRKVLLGLLLVLLLLGGWWCGVRPRLLVQRARLILPTEPRVAADLLEEAYSTSLVRSRDAEVLWSRALLRSGQVEEALGCFSLIERPERAAPEGLIALADDALAAPVPYLASLALEAIPSDSTLRGAALERLVGLRLQAGDAASARTLAAEWTQVDPTAPGPSFALALIDEQRHEFTEAIAHYRAALSKAPSGTARPDWQRSIVRISILVGDREAARQMQDQLLKSGAPLTVTDRLHEAQLRRLEGQIDAALEAVQEVLSTDSKLPAARELRGTLAMDRKDYATAEADFREVLIQQPRNKGVHYKLAQTLAKSGREAEAAPHFEENRRLLKLSLRVIELQGLKERTTADNEELQRLLQQIQ